MMLFRLSSLVLGASLLSRGAVAALTEPVAPVGGILPVRSVYPKNASAIAWYI